jgi:hypothetical protein
MNYEKQKLVFTYERCFYVNSKDIQKFIELIDMFTKHGDIKDSLINYVFSRQQFQCIIRFFGSDDYILFHNVAVSFMTGIKAE